MFRKKRSESFEFHKFILHVNKGKIYQKTG
jgi:hypothetical protein